MSKLKVRTVSRSDINEKNLLIFVRAEWLPIPKSIIPPRRKEFLWKTLQLQSYDSSRDYPGKLLDNLRFAIHRTIREWSDIDGIARVGVWLSGGIDSGTWLYLTCETLGPENVRAYSVDFGDQNEVDMRLLIEEMTMDDGTWLTEDAVLYSRGPACTTHVLFASKLCRRAATINTFLGLLDEGKFNYVE